MAVPALAVLRVMRRRLPRQAAAALSARALSRRHGPLATGDPGAGRERQPGGGDLYVWTVDHAPRIRELHSLGVTGVITNDPRLFGALR